MIIKRAFICVFLVVTIGASAQRFGKPFITNYSSKTFKGHTQNWCIEQDTFGTMYFGNQVGVLSFDGNFWRQIPVNNHSTVRSLTLDKNNCLYVGAVGEFGFLKPDSTGRLEYKSLVHKIDSGYQKFGDVWSCQAVDSVVYFLTDNYLYIYNGEHVKVKTTQGNYFYSCFVLGGALYVHDFGHGLLKKDSQFKLLPGGTAFAQVGIHGLMKGDSNELILATRNNGVYRLDTVKKEIQIFSPTLHDWFVENQVYYATAWSDSLVAFGTLRGGIGLVDQSGKAREVINKANGLQNESVYYLKPTGNELWAALDNGISMVEVNSPVRFWDETMGLKGTINDILKLNNKLYVATGSGVYYLNSHDILDGVLRFKPVHGIESQCWDLYAYSLPSDHSKILYVGASNGLYQVTDSTSFKIRESEAVFQIEGSNLREGVIYLGQKSRLSQIRINTKTNVYTDYTQLLETDKEIRDLYEDESGYLWAGMNYKGVARMWVEDTTVSKFKLFTAEDGLDFKREVRAYDFHGKTIFSTEKGVFNYFPEEGRFYRDTAFENAFKTEKGKITLFSYDSTGNYWINGKYYYKKAGKLYAEDTLLLKRLPDFSVETQYIDRPGSLWVGSTEGLYHVTKADKSVKVNNYHTLIREVSIKNDSVLYFGNAPQKNIPQLNKYNNFIRFKYSAGFFEKPGHVQYSFFLEGYDDQWSEWSTENRKEFTNLFEGTYTFNVKSRNLYNKMGQIDSFTFKVLPPWYRTVWAYIAYVLLTGFLIYIVVYLRTRKLRLDKLKLEGVIRKRTEEIRLQKNELQKTASHLKDANRELKKLSVIAQKTDNAVAIFDAQGNIEWINEGFTQMYGFTLEQFKNEKGENLIKSSANPHIQAAIKKCIRNKETAIYEFFTLTRQNEGIWAQTTLTPILDETGELLKLIAIDGNVTKLKDAEQKIELQRDELEKANKTKDKFFSIIAHDLRGPLSNIFTLLNIIYNDLENFDKDYLKKLIGQLKETTGNTFNLTENLLDWAHLRKDSIQYKPETFYLKELAEENIELFKSQANKKKLILKNEIPESEKVFADVEMIKTVIRNLMGNAIKFTGVGGEITLSASKKENHVLVMVSDTGKGMGPDEVEKLFRIDVHHSTLGTQQEKGTGLGLILTKEFVEKNKGEIYVESKPGKGSVFSFSLPIVK